MNRQISSALFFAALILGVSFGSRWAMDAGYLQIDPTRISGVVMGIVLIWMGNAMPKQSPEKTCGQDPGAAFRMKRLAGMLMMIGGFGHALAWLLAPIDIAAWVSIIPVAATGAIVIATAIKARVWV